MYLMAGMIPDNLASWSTQTSSFRDLVMAHIVSANASMDALTTFINYMRASQSLTTQQDIALCEYAAMLSIATDNIDLFKEILLRVPPMQATSLLKGLYQSVVVNKLISGTTYRNIIMDSATQATLQWEGAKRYIS
jgi:hypothetical protein